MKKKSLIAEKIISVVSKTVLSTGLFVASVTQGILFSTVYAESDQEKINLEKGTYVEGEVLAFVVEDSEIELATGSKDLLKNTEEIMKINTDDSEVELAGAAKGNSSEIEHGTIRLIRSDTLSTAELMEVLGNDPRVICVEPNYVVSNEEEGEEAEVAAVPVEEMTHSLFGPSGYSEDEIPEMTDFQWGNYNDGVFAGTYTAGVNADTGYNAWKYQDPETSEEFVVGVIDSGIDETNPDLKGVLWSGEVFGDGGDSHGYYSYPSAGVSSTRSLTSEHGTHVAGIIAAEWNGQGVSGVASNVKLMSLRHNDDVASILRCMDYAKSAVLNGVKMVAINNSWALGACTSNLVNVAVTELGKLGVVNVFGSGNDSENTDKTMSTPAGIANNPYAVVVNAITPDGDLAYYSNYGIGTTEVMAPGSMILSTVFNDESHMQFLGEVNAHAPFESEARKNLVSYTSFDDADVNAFESFSIYCNADGKEYGSDLAYPYVKPEEGAFDGIAVLSIKTDSDGHAGITSNVVDLSALEEKPRYVSFRVKAKDHNCYGQPAAVEVPVIYALNDGTIMKTTKMIPLSGLYCVTQNEYGGMYADLAYAEMVSEYESAAGIVDCYINWEEFSLSLLAISASSSGYEEDTIYFDSIALGSGRYPFSYMDGTSMACPAATGVLSVIAGKYHERLGEFGTASYAEKLAALVKGASIKDEKYKNICATSAYVSVKGAEDAGPVISAVSDGDTAITVTGYFMRDASVSIDSTECSSEIRSLGNDKYEMKVQKPANFKGGAAVVQVTGINDKIDRSVVNLSAASSEDMQAMFDYCDMDYPVGLAEWSNYDMLGYNGKIYVIPRSSVLAFTTSCANVIYEYDPKEKVWSEISIPVESFTTEGKPVISTLLDTTACLKDGKMILLLNGISEDMERVNLMISLDPEYNMEMIATSNDEDGVPYAGTLASDGEQLYLSGGFIQTVNGPGMTNAICRLSIENMRIHADAVDASARARLFAHVTYQNGTFIISSGAGSNTGWASTSAGGVDRVVIDERNESVNVDMVLSGEANLAFTSGALSDGRFILTGPVCAEGTADTYILNDDGTLDQYSKRAYMGNLLSPTSVSYDGYYYVLGTVSAQEGGVRPMFSYTKIDTPVPSGDALIRDIVSVDAKTTEGVPAVTNTAIVVTQKDLYDNLSENATPIITKINNASDQSEVYLDIRKLEAAEVPETDRNAIMNVAAQEGVGDDMFWMDISMFLKTSAVQPVQLHAIGRATEVTMGTLYDFPTIDEGYSRSYKVFAYHAGAPENERLEVIDPEYNPDDNTLTFNISRCSTFAIGYTDEPVPTPVPTPQPADDGTSEPSSEPETVKTESKDTGDSSNLLLWGSLAAGSMMIIVAATVLRKKED